MLDQWVSRRTEETQGQTEMRTEMRQKNDRTENPTDKYNPQAIKAKWQKRWTETAIYRTLSLADRPTNFPVSQSTNLPTFYCLDFFSLPVRRRPERRARPQLCAHRRHLALLPYERIRRAPFEGRDVDCLEHGAIERGASGLATLVPTSVLIPKRLPRPGRVGDSFPLLCTKFTHNSPVLAP